MATRFGIVKRETDPLLPRASSAPRHRLEVALASFALGGTLFFLFAAFHSTPLQTFSFMSASSPHSVSIQEEIHAAEQIRSMMDPSVDPCDDFWQYSCGGFLQNTPVKGDLGRFGIAEVIIEQSQNALHAILAKVRVQPEDQRSRSQTRLIAFYESCLNLSEINKLGLQPIRKYLDQLSEAESFTDLLVLVATLHRQSKKSESRQSTITYTRPFFSWQVERNLIMSSSDMVLSLAADGISLPDTSYYLDSAYAHLIPKYTDHIMRMLTLSGMDPDEAQAAANSVIHLETKLARTQRSSWSGDAVVYDVEKIKKLTPAIDWDAYLEALFKPTGLPLPKKIHFDSFLYFELLNKLVTEVEFNVLRDYLRFHLVHLNARFLSQDFIDEDFKFFGVQVTGANPNTPVERWRECVRMADSNLPDDLGQEFISNLFPSHAKAVAESMLEDIERAFGQIIREDKWIGTETQKAAVGKLNKITNRVFSTNNWDKYEGIAINQLTYADNVFNCRAHQSHRELDQIEKGHNPELWGMSPPSVNAYYNPTWNEMVFPAGIFRPTYYSLSQSDAYNYGALGVTMGHELGHAFDSNGRDYDAEGYQRSWMTKSAIKQYNERAQCVVDLFSGYEVAGLRLDGDLTLNENLADISGVKTSFRAYRNHRKELEKIGKLPNEDRLVDLISPNLTPEQLYFIAYGQSWCEVETSAYQIRSTKEVHSPAKWRVIGPISQSQEFARAFKCNASSPMNPPKKCKVW